jgi:hypothetical protein
MIYTIHSSVQEKTHNQVKENHLNRLNKYTLNLWGSIYTYMYIVHNTTHVHVYSHREINRTKSKEVGFLVLLSCYADLFNLRSFDLSPGLGLPRSIQSHSPLHICITTQITDRYMVRRELLLTHIVFIRAKRNRDREKSSGQTHLFSIKEHGQNLRSTPGHTEPIAQYFFKNQHLYTYFLGDSI